MNLSDIAFSSYLYKIAWSENRELYVRLREALRRDEVLARAQTGETLLEWLNSWGCRLDKSGFSSVGYAELSKWYGTFVGKLPSDDESMLALTDGQLDWAAEAYEDLFHRKASARRRFQATASAKILFAVKPNAFPPWDQAIRDGLKLDGTRKSYREFLDRARSELQDLEKSCALNGVKLGDLSSMFHRENWTLPKIVDEYFWIKFTQKCPTPDGNTLRQWLHWSASSPRKGVVTAAMNSQERTVEQ